MGPAGKARRRSRITWIRRGGATQPAGMQRQPTGKLLLGRDTRMAGTPRLWAPWRMEYVRSAVDGKPRRGKRPGRSATCRCLFCRVGRSGNDRADLVLVRRPHAFLMLNRFPYNPAHLMVAVARHAATFAEL